VKQISIFLVGLAAAFASVPVAAEDFTAGKTPAQLFRSDCGECHRSPNGLARDPDVRALAGFLREHYTTKSETAGALAAYVSGFASTGAGRNRGSGVAAPPVRDRSRPRSDAESEDAPARSVDEPPVRHRRTVTITVDGEKKRRAYDDGNVPRPPRGIGTASPKPNAQTRASEPADDPVSRLRGYLSSGMNSESAIAEAGKTGAPKARKRRGATDDAQAGAKANADVPAAAPPAAMPRPADAPAETAPGEP
jgi:hypothetical protein